MPVKQLLRYPELIGNRAVRQRPAGQDTGLLIQHTAQAEGTDPGHSFSFLLKWGSERGTKRWGTTLIFYVATRRAEECFARAEDPTHAAPCR
jgi:hypothetical protein